MSDQHLKVTGFLEPNPLFCMSKYSQNIGKWRVNDDMAPPSPAPGRGTRTDPKVQQSFDGDQKILNSTFDSRTEIRKALQNLKQVLQRNETHAVQVVADIKLRVSGSNAREHTYTVTIHDDSWDTEAFASRLAGATRKDSLGSASKNLVGSDGSRVASQSNGKRPSSVRSEPRVIADDDDDVVEVRPFKKARMGADDATISTSQDKYTDGVLRETSILLKKRDTNEALDFMK